MTEPKRVPQDSVTKQQFMAMAPSMAATLGVTEKQVTAALAAALDNLASPATTEHTADEQAQSSSIAPLLTDKHVVTMRQRPAKVSGPTADCTNIKGVPPSKAIAEHATTDNSDDSEEDVWIECSSNSCMECCSRRKLQDALAGDAHDAGS